MAKKHKFTHTTIEHHDDNSHTITHHHKDGPAHDKKYAAADHDSMLDGVMDHTSEPNPGEAESQPTTAGAGAAAPPPPAGGAGLPGM